MTLKVSRVDLWTASIDDRAGGAADKLEPLSKAGANFEFVFSRRTPELPGRGMLFVTPMKGTKVVQAAQATGFTKPENLHSVRIEGANKPGVTVKVARPGERRDQFSRTVGDRDRQQVRELCRARHCRGSSQSGEPAEKTLLTGLHQNRIHGALSVSK